jgi:hypothetical protein
MTGETIKEFLIGLGFAVDESSLASFKGAISSASIGAAALGAASIAAAGALFGTVQHIAATYFELNKLAIQFRTTADAVDSFMDVGKILGLSEEQTVGSLKSLDRAIGDTALNIGRAKLVFAQIGQQVLDAGGKMRPTTVVMDELADKFSKMERGKALAVMERLGLDPALLKMFNADLLTLRKEIGEIEAAAGFNMADAIAESKAFTMSWRGFTQELEKVKLLFSKMVDVIAIRLMPRFRASLDSLTGHIAGLRKLVMQNMEQIQKVIDGAIGVLLRLVEFVSTAASRLVQLVTSVIGGIASLFAQLTPLQQGVVVGVAALIAAWKLLNLSFLATPLGMVLTLIAGIALLVEDFITWKNGGDSLIDWGSTFGQVLFVLTGIVAALTAAYVIAQGAMMAYGAAVTAMNGVMALARGAALAFNAVLALNPVTLWALAIVAAVALIAGIAYLVYDNWAPIMKWFTDAWEKVGSVVKTIGKAISSVAGGLFGSAGETAKPSTSSQGAPAQLSIPAPSGGGFLESLAGMGKSMLGFGTQPMLTPAGAMAGGGGQQISQKTDIIVQGTNNPQATARAVALEQIRVNADLARNMKGVAQ